MKLYTFWHCPECRKEGAGNEVTTNHCISELQLIHEDNISFSISGSRSDDPRERGDRRACSDGFERLVCVQSDVYAWVTAPTCPGEWEDFEGSQLVNCACKAEMDWYDRFVECCSCSLCSPLEGPLKEFPASFSKALKEHGAEIALEELTELVFMSSCKRRCIHAGA